MEYHLWKQQRVRTIASLAEVKISDLNSVPRRPLENPLEMQIAVKTLSERRKVFPSRVSIVTVIQSMQPRILCGFQHPTAFASPKVILTLSGVDAVES